MLGAAADPLSAPPELPFQCLSSPEPKQDCCLPGQLETLGTNGPDTIVFSDSVSRCVLGLAGDDTVETGSGADVHLGNLDDDHIRTGLGNDIALGGYGGDLIELYQSSSTEVHSNLAHGGPGNDEIHGAAGDDQLFGNEGNDTIAGYGGNDTIVPGPSLDDVYGGAGDDVIIIGSPCEVTSGELVFGGPGTDTVRSPLSQAELEAMGVTFNSIEVFETMLRNPLGAGACYSDAHTKIRCECCDPGWGGNHCRECQDPSLCGFAVTAPLAKPLRTKYATYTIPEFGGGVYAEAVPARQTINLPAAITVPSDGDGWFFDDQMSGSQHTITGAFSAGQQAEVIGEGFVWTLGLHSDGAQKMSLTLDGLVLPPGTELWVYSETALHGPVTFEELAGTFRSVVPPLDGDTVYLEIFQPLGTNALLDELSVAPIAHGAPPDSCFEDVACVPSAAPQAEGVGIIYRAGNYWCSGSMINADSTEPLFLTAEHCIARDPIVYASYLADSPSAGTEIDSEWMFSFDSWEQYVQLRYRNTRCEVPSLDELSETLTYTVEDLVYHDHEADIAIVKLAGAPDPTCVTYNGFDARYAAPLPPYSAGIRHPAGRLAQIDIDNAPPDTTAFFDANPAIEENFVFGAYDPFWSRKLHQSNDTGWLEGGASGGPVFDNHGRIIGQLSGHDGNLDACGSAASFFDGRLGAAYEISLDYPPPLEGVLPSILASTMKDPPAWTTQSDPFPMFHADVTPCTDECANFQINPQVSDEADVHWSYSGDVPGQVVGLGQGVTESPSGNVQIFAFTICLAEVSPGGNEPDIQLRIEVDFGPSHAECPTTVRDLIISPQHCN